MYQPVKWWSGLVVLLPLWIIANWSTIRSVEADLGARALAAVPAATLDQPAVSVAGRDVTLAGMAFSPALQAAAMSAAEAVPGVRRVNSSVQPLATAKPYSFAARLDAGKLALSGNVPDPATRARLLAAAKVAAPQASIVDAMGYAAGAPEKFESMGLFALAQIGLLSAGSALVTDGSYAINGTAATSAAASKAQADASGALPAGFKLAEAKIIDIEAGVNAAAVAAKEQADKAAAAAAKEQADEAAAAAAKEQADKAAAAAAKEQADKAAAAVAKDQADKAAAAKEQADKAAAAAAKEQADKAAAAAAKDQADKAAAAAAKEQADKAAAAAAKDQAEKAAAAAAAKDQADKAAAAVAKEQAEKATAAAAKDQADKAVAAAAAAKEEADKATAAAAKDQADKAAAAAAAGKDQADKAAAATAAKDQADKAAVAAAKEQADKAAGASSTAGPAASEVDVPTCQTLFNEALGENKIQFKQARADIDEASLPLLSTIVQTARRCPKAHIEISGHTDSDGDAQANVELSKNRAEAVLAFLVEAGLDPARLKAEGIGDAKPIATNATAEGKAQNRRIEIHVTE